MYIEPVLPLNYMCPSRITHEQRNESTISNSRSAFQDQCITEITPDIFNDYKDKMAILSNTLLDIAADNIPKTSPFPKRKAKPSVTQYLIIWHPTQTQTMQVWAQDLDLEKSSTHFRGRDSKQTKTCLEYLRDFFMLFLLIRKWRTICSWGHWACSAFCTVLTASSCIHLGRRKQAGCYPTCGQPQEYVNAQQTQEKLRSLVPPSTPQSSYPQQLLDVENDLIVSE